MKERYHITGMTCSACSSHVEKAANKLEGVEKASVNLLTETMEISYDEAKLSPQQIIEAVVAAGYGASPLQQEKKGTASDKKDARETIKQESQARDKAMKQRLFLSLLFLIPLMYVSMYHMYHEWFGLPIPRFMHLYFHGPENGMTYAMTQFLLLLPILYLNRKFFQVGFKTLFHRAPNMDSLVAIGAGAAVGYGLFAMYRISYALGHGNPEMAGQYAGDLYFESAGTILTLITIGKYLEGRSKGKTGEAIAKLMKLAPKTAILVDAEGKEREVPTEDLQVGDIYLLKPGSQVPVDGVVVDGNSSVDESAITGESVPVEKHTGDKVISASVNKAGFLKCRATAVGDDTTLAQIIKLVEDASATKAPIAKLADKVAGVFVPVVIAIALITLAVWLVAGAGAEFAISSAIAVLVISCPCALGLATPVAIMVGTGVGANHGVLIKSGEALQRAREVDTVVLDKTGTITSGKLRVDGVFCYGEYSPDCVLALSAALEKKSEHPLAEAIVTAGIEKGLNLPNIEAFHAVFGRGVEGNLAADFADRSSIETDGPTAVFGAGTASKKAALKKGTKILIGNQAYLEENGIVLQEIAVQAITGIGDEGMTALLVAFDGRLQGIISVVDEVKVGSREAIKRLHEMKIQVVMLTGDNRRTAEAVRSSLNIEKVIAEVLPQDKEAEIRKLQAEGRKVAMVGDGINDAPALTAADVGMAIGAGTDVAMDSADIVLMKSDLRDAVTAIRLSRAVIRNIKQNLFWAFFYNAIGIPLAAGLWYPMFGLRLSPMFGAAAMSMSSIFVVGNALRLKGFKDDFVREVPAAKQEGPSDQIEETQTEEISEEKENSFMMKTMTIEGMMCAHCTGRVQKALEAIEGVASVEMSLENKTATVQLSSDVADEVLTKAVADAGYDVVGIA